LGKLSSYLLEDLLDFPEILKEIITKKNRPETQKLCVLKVKSNIVELKFW
jgi:hypothetical protein